MGFLTGAAKKEDKSSPGKDNESNMKNYFQRLEETLFIRKT
jgi:hypothetical protein